MLTNKTIDNTNSKHLELYTILGEYDNTGFPLSYCLLTTASSLEVQKRTRALETWGAVLRNTYGLVPRFVHTDKDMAEIGASQRVWPEAKHQLCWWHQREALRRRLKGSLPTSRYNAQHAHQEYPFISLTFTPHGHVDPNDCEGGVPGEVYEQEVTPQTFKNPNSIKVRIPALSQRTPGQTSQNMEDDMGGPTLGDDHSISSGGPAHSATDGLGVGGLTRGSGCSGSLGGPSVTGKRGTPTLTLTNGHPDSRTIRIPVRSNGIHTGEPRALDHLKHTIRLPAPSTLRPEARNEPGPDEEVAPGFCPIEYRDTVIGIMERHFCAHPFIPGYSAQTPEGIKCWAVEQMYEFCVLHELPNLWAYLWENWYRCGRWELWARSGNPREIPRLKTTMLVEGQ